jgi:hypothetical protein
MLSRYVTIEHARHILVKFIQRFEIDFLLQLLSTQANWCSPVEHTLV